MILKIFKLPEDRQFFFSSPYYAYYIENEHLLRADMNTDYT